MSIAPLLDPRPRRLPSPERHAPAREARQAAFDILELVAMAVALIGAMLVLRAGTDGARAFSVESALTGLAVLGVTAGLLLVRRARRGRDRVPGERA